MKVGSASISLGSIPLERAAAPAVKDPTRGAFAAQVDELIKDWGRADNVVARNVEKLKGEQRTLFETQMLVSRVMLQTELLVKGAEAVSSVMRKVQQFGQ